MRDYGAYGVKAGRGARVADPGAVLLKNRRGALEGKISGTGTTVFRMPGKGGAGKLKSTR